MKFTDTHEWVKIDHSIGTIGVTDYAQKELGDIVYVELPPVGKIVSKGKEAAVLESTKAAADIYAPISGTVVEINDSLRTQAELVNQSPEKDGWLFKVTITHPEEADELLDEEAYKNLLQ